MCAKTRRPCGLRHSKLLVMMGAVLCLFGSTIAVSAQNTDTQGDPAKRREDTSPPPPRTNGVLTIGDDVIDPNQPIRPEFQINVSVVGEETASGTYIVDQVGNVSIRYAGAVIAVLVRDKTPKEAGEAITTELKKYLKSPQVSVTIVQVPRPEVAIYGAVKNSGRIRVTNRTTLADVIGLAQPTDNADLSLIRITSTKKSGETEKPRIINFKKYLEATTDITDEELLNPVVKNNDRIIVPIKVSSTNGVVSVSGEILKPLLTTLFRPNPPLTVAEAIAQNGGTSPMANRKAIIVKRALGGKLLIDLDKADMGDTTNNIELQADDSIYVPRQEMTNSITVSGGFAKPGRVPYDRRMTLTQVIQDAGGPIPYAKVGQGRIFRHPDNNPKNLRIITFNWNNIAQGKQQDIELQPGDAVWVEPGNPSRQPLDLFGTLNLITSLSLVYGQFKK